MIYECTDCKHCAIFDDGYRIICLHPDFPPTQVYDFQPLGEEDADYCKGFDDSADPHDYSMQDFLEADKSFVPTVMDEITLREWCEKNPRNANNTG